MVWLTGDVAALTGGGGTLSFSRPGLMGRGPATGLVARGLRVGGVTAPPPVAATLRSAGPAEGALNAAISSPDMITT